MSKKVLYFDVETTGTDSHKHDIVQLSGAVEVDGEIKEDFNFRIQPFDFDTIDPKAMEVTGLTIEDLRGYEKPLNVFPQFTHILEKYVDKYDRNDKFYPAGYNVRFDLDFVQQWFYKCGNKYGFGAWQNWKAMDPLPVLQFMDTQGMISLPNYKLSTVCDHFGIAINAHDALSDINATKAVIRRVSELFKG